MTKKPKLKSGNLEVRAKHLEIAYGQQVAFKSEEFNTSGRILGIIGHNGSGKSTLIKSLLELLPPSKGSLQAFWREQEATFRLLPEHHMAFSPENGAIFEDITVESYLKLWCRIKRGNSRYYVREGRGYLEKLNLAPLLPKLGRELSKGQRRRVQSAVGFLTDPLLFLFDEPFDGLDIMQSNELASIMMEESSRMSMIVSSHRMDVIERLADRIIVLRDGRVHASGTVEEVCALLGGQSVVISNSPDHQIPISSLLPALKKEFYSCLINQIGHQLLITGDDINQKTLELFFLKNSLSGVSFNFSRPSLVDAMRFHLNKLN